MDTILRAWLLLKIETILTKVFTFVARRSANLGDPGALFLTDRIKTARTETNSESSSIRRDSGVL